ncbi:hypothetical protein PVAND_008697 [Polypedilum vanderplanki]|uniref:N-acetyltransferase domain-containing protein n=1 Tax=Polypedilum vanderplanki TaxID=319348 RepID=A0A9J6CB45_POLVA|nr:hypothetical protein PVAND_008697 [Polypedilum vanderplanki]
MFSKFLVKTKLPLSTLYSTAVTTGASKGSSKSFISSLFVPKRQIDLTKCRFEIAKRADINSTLKFIEDNFFKNEPLCKSLHLTGKKLEQPTENLIRDGIKQGMTILARENSDDNEILGICMNTRSCPWDGEKLEEFAKLHTDMNARKLLHIWALMAREPRLHQELGQLSIFEVGMLAVKESHEACGLGTELTRRSLDLGRDLNFRHARINCTSEYSIKIAEKLGMTRVWDVFYRNIFMPDGKTPLTVPVHPHVQAAVFLTDLKKSNAIEEL